jgi:hypothetical protein
MPITPDPATVVRATDRLWSEEVRLAEATEPLPPYDTAYEFSNGRRFRQPADPYAPAEE